MLIYSYRQDARVKNPHRDSVSQHGFTLIEVLVSLVILSVGLLGIAGMITTSLRTNDSAYLRTEANIMAYSILDRMRTNRTAATQSEYDVSTGSYSKPGTDCLESSSNTSPDCNPANMAAWDLYEWKQELADNLPSGDGTITTSLNSGGVVEITITVKWNSSRAEQGLSNTSASSSATNTFSTFTVTSGI